MCQNIIFYLLIFKFMLFDNCFTQNVQNFNNRVKISGHDTTKFEIRRFQSFWKFYSMLG